MKKKNQKLFILVGVLLLFGGISLSYFVSKAILGGNGGSTSVTTAVIKGATLNVEGLLSFEDLDILPGHKTVSSIKVTATGNNELIPYNLIWQGTNTLTTPLNFTIYKTSEQLSVTSTCSKKTKIISGAQALSEECTISNLDKLGNEIASGTINKNETKVTLVKDEFITAINSGISYYYYIILEYPNLDEPQNEDLNGTFEGEVTVEESNIKPDINILAAYVVQDDGTYKEVEDIPQDGYQLNTEKSTCSNGTIPGWNIKEHMFYTTNLTKSGTSCYLYFDIKKQTATETLIQNFKVVLKSGNPVFSKAAKGEETENNNGVYQIEDGMYGGTSYYWRGAVKTNYAKFAGFCWRIVRINGDGTIRLIYDGEKCHANGISTTENLAVVNQVYNNENNRNEYVGYTYTLNSQRPINNENGTPSNLKSQTDLWFNNIIKDFKYSDKVAYGKFCNDRNTASGYTWKSQNAGTLNYAAYPRSGAGSSQEPTPTLSCDEKDIYTLKAGSITADEVILAGSGEYALPNTNYYLYNGQYYWTITPFSGSGASVGQVGNNGSIGANNVNQETWGIRPVINLKSDVTFSSGDGTIDNPYIVAD